MTLAGNRGPGNLCLGFPAGLRLIISLKKTLPPFSKGSLASERGAVRPGENHAALTSLTHSVGEATNQATPGAA